jgi:PAS domain S-box-containing protein
MFKYNENKKQKNMGTKTKALPKVVRRGEKIITVVNSKRTLNPEKTIMSKTNEKGIIEYANEYFMEISGYNEGELMGRAHNIIRHPDMPRVIFKLLWDRLKNGKNIHAIVKNLAKDGRYYWVITNFETKYDENGEIIAHYSRRKMAPTPAVLKIERLYHVLLEIEKHGDGMKASEKYFSGMLEDIGMDYDQWILSVLNTTPKELEKYFQLGIEIKKKNNFFSRLFNKK